MAAVVVVGQLASIAHLVLVRHVTCAEHGELIELGHDRVTNAMSASRRTTTVANSSSAETHGHEHCLVASTRRERISLRLQPIADSLRVDAYGTVGLGRDVDIAPPIALILIAPKNSPPLV